MLQDPWDGTKHHLADQKASARDRVLTHLNQQMTYWLAYHNHKENMAWLVTAAFVVSCATLVAGPGLNDGAKHPGPSVALLIGAYFVLIFMNMQFKNRWIAADLVAAIHDCIAELNTAHSGAQIMSQLDRPAKRERAREEVALDSLPSCVGDKYGKGTLQKRRTIPNRSFWSIESWNDDRGLSENVSGLVVILAAVFAAVKLSFWPSLGATQSQRIAALEQQLKAQAERVTSEHIHEEDLYRRLDSALLTYRIRLEDLERVTKAKGADQPVKRSNAR
jgi:hypothetical protein